MNHSSRRQLPALLTLSLALMLGLSACLGLSTTPSEQPTISINNSLPNLSPTPTAPAYLVGAYVNNNTPTSSSGNLIVYVIFHHGQLPQAGGRVSLYFHYNADGGGISGLNREAGTQTTGADGYAIFYLGYSGLPYNIPVSIDVTVHFTGTPDIVKKNATSFSVIDLTPSANPSASPGG